LKRIEEERLLKYNSEEALKRVRAAMKRRILLKKERELIVIKEQENEEENKKLQLQLVQAIAKQRLEEDKIKKKRREWKRKLKLGLLPPKELKAMKKHKSKLRDGDDIMYSNNPHRYPSSSDDNDDDDDDDDDEVHEKKNRDECYGRADITSAHEIFDSLEMEFQFDNFLDEAAVFQLHETVIDNSVKDSTTGDDDISDMVGNVHHRNDGNVNLNEENLANGDTPDGHHLVPLDLNHPSKLVRVVDDWDDLYIDHNGQQVICNENDGDNDAIDDGNHDQYNHDYGDDDGDDEDGDDGDDYDDDDANGYQDGMNDHALSDYLLLTSIDNMGNYNKNNSYDSSLQNLTSNATTTNKVGVSNKPSSMMSSKVIKKLPHQLQKTPYYAHYRSYHDKKGVEG